MVESDQHGGPKVWLLYQFKQDLACHQGRLPLKSCSSLADRDVKVTSKGRPYLGGALGTEEYIHKFVTDGVQEWVEELEQLATIAQTQPHAA